MLLALQVAPQKQPRMRKRNSNRIAKEQTKLLADVTFGAGNFLSLPKAHRDFGNDGSVRASVYYFFIAIGMRKTKRARDATNAMKKQRDDNFIHSRVPVGVPGGHHKICTLRG